jgi:EVE domain
VTGYWIGVASRDHVLRGVAGGFCQLGHGKTAPLKRLKPGDRIVYYSPRERLNEGAPLQAFTAIGEVAEGEITRLDMGKGFVPYRRAVKFYAASEAPIRPLLPRLALTRGRANWGMIFRGGLVAIAEADYAVIAKAMKVTEDAGLRA